MLDRIYIPQKPVEDTEEMEYTEVEKETHSITAENQNNNYDLHPSIMKKLNYRIILNCIV